jgi:diguanylate cyclase (GGDEF)-like protein
MGSLTLWVLLVFLWGILIASMGFAYKQSRALQQLRQQEQESHRHSPQKSLLLSKLHLETSSAIVFSFDCTFQFLEMNQKGLKFYGLAEDTPFDFNWIARFVKPDHQPELTTTLKKSLNVNRAHCEIDALCIEINQSIYTLSLNIVFIDQTEFDAPFYLCSATDLTEQMHAQNALQLSSESFDNIVNQNQTGILVVNQKGIVKFCNPATEKLMGRTHEQVIDSYLGTPVLSDPSSHSEFDIIRPDGTFGVSEISFSNTEWQNEAAYLVMMYDITELKEAHQEIENIALHDALTGLANRRLFNETLLQVITRHKRNKNSFALLFLDLDHFKDVNDALGHAISDELLVQVTSRINKILRNIDYFSRMGGDEFSIILDSVDSKENVALVCDKVTAQFNHPFMIQRQAIEMNASIGVVFYPNDTTDSDDLLKMADLAMYQAKKSTHYSYQFYNEELMENFKADFGLESQLKKAIKNSEFELYYQPQVSADLAEFTGVEALIRWQHPQKGLVSPDAFIPALERTGLIVQVGTWVLHDALRQLKIWLAKGYSCPRVSINVCVLQFLEDDFVSTVNKALADYQVDAKYLAIEITESIFIENKARLLAQLQQLQALGVHIHMDDFGTGYSSLSMVKDIPFDTIKIDQSFVKDLVKNERERLLVRSIISIIHAYGKCVLVEGVELGAQRVILAEEGCDEIQGYLYARPMPAEELEKGYLNL